MFVYTDRTKRSLRYTMRNSMIRLCVCCLQYNFVWQCLSAVATKKPQHLVPFLLHLVPAARWFLRAKYVCRGCYWELPQVPRESGARRESSARSQTRKTTQPKA